MKKTNAVNVVIEPAPPSKPARLVYAFLGALIGFAFFAGCIFVFSPFNLIEDFNYSLVYRLLAGMTVAWFVRRAFQILGGAD